MQNPSELIIFTHLRRIHKRVFTSCPSIHLGNNKNPSSSLSQNGIFASCSLLTVILLFALSFTCLYNWDFNSHHMYSISNVLNDNDSVGAVVDVDDDDILGDWNGECDVSIGKWVRDEGFRVLYNATECPFAEQGFDCLGNGRKDRGYLEWRWKPKNCEIPRRLDVGAVLEYLRGKRVAFVGDSLSRTQWESFICMMMAGVEDRKSVYEVNGNEITKRIRFLGVRFGSHNFTVEFHRSVFLGLIGPAPRKAPKRVRSTLRIDEMDDASKKWEGADVLVFNTGHWWTKTKLFEMGTYFQVDGSVKLGMPIMTALKLTLETWASWVDSAVNPNKTRLFFRTFESAHWSDASRVKCKVTVHPTTRTKGRDRNPISDIILNVVKNMTVPVTPLHVTPMGAYRSDAHVGRWSDNPLVTDCSHWCLPGLPDTWNEFLLFHLLGKDALSP
ncbi:trichome berefringence-like 7-like protein [Drosera capensis]